MQQNNKTVLDLLRGSTAFQDCSLRIGWGEREGRIHVRNGAIAAAEVGFLSGNGAVLDIARWQGVQIDEFDSDPVTKKNVTLSLHEIEKVFKDFSIRATLSPTYDDQRKLEQAILLIHQFRYRDAGSLLAEILKYNRFNYLAWLWYSRLLGKINSIQKALDEARKWGDHAPEVWLEVKKTGVGLANIESDAIKRCLFCWTPLNKEDRVCCYCMSPQSIQKKSSTVEIKKAELKKTINHYLGGFARDEKNTRICYTLAVAFYSLGMYEKAIKYINKAIETAPEKSSYQRAKKYLESYGKTPVKVPDAMLSTTLSANLQREKPVAGDQDGKPVILVVEDSPTARKVIKMVLAREGFGVVEASSGKEALEMAKEVRPRLVLLDVMLPDMTGYDILPQLRQNKHMVETPVVMLTGKKGSMDRMKGMLAGSSEYLTKPFNPQKLTTIIKKYL